jgi:hypothetical protein
MEARFDGDGAMAEAACEEGLCGVVFVLSLWRMLAVAAFLTLH